MLTMSVFHTAPLSWANNWGIGVAHVEVDGASGHGRGDRPGSGVWSLWFRVDQKSQEESSRMTVEGNVIRCDECGLQVSMAMQSVPIRPTLGLTERVRDFATAEGWTCGEERDVCSNHKTGPA